MIKKFKIKPMPFSKKKRPIQIPITPRPCDCSGEPDDTIESNDEYVAINNIWTPERDITSHDQLMALTDEPLFLTGNPKWQEKELRANTRELELCSHFKKKITPEYLSFFVKELLAKKEQHIKATHQMPVTFYMWYSVFGHRFYGHSYLCYNFLSGDVKKLPFGDGLILKNQPHVDTFMRKFLTLRRDWNPYKISRVINLDMTKHKSVALSDDELLKSYKKFIRGIGNSKTRMLPKELMI